MQTSVGRVIRWAPWAESRIPLVEPPAAALTWPVLFVFPASDRSSFPVLRAGLSTLLCLSSCLGGGVEGVEGSVEVSGEVTLDGSADLASAASFGEAFLEVGLGAGVAAHTGDRDVVQCLVQTSVSASVEAVPGGVAAGGGDGVHAGEGGERGVVADSAGVGPRGDDDRGGVCADAGLLQQRRGAVGLAVMSSLRRE